MLQQNPFYRCVRCKNKIEISLEEKPEDKILKYFKILFNGIVILGATLCILYFGFTIKATPNINEVSQIINYIITLAGIALVLIFLFSMFMILPSIIFSIDSKLFENETKETIAFLLGFPFIAHILISFSLYYKVEKISNFINLQSTFFFLYYLFFSIPIFYVFTKKYRLSILFSFLLPIIAQTYSWLSNTQKVSFIHFVCIPLLILALISLPLFLKLRKPDWVEPFSYWCINFFEKYPLLKPIIIFLFNISLLTLSLFFIGDVTQGYFYAFLYFCLISTIALLYIFGLPKIEWFKQSIDGYSLYTGYWFLSFGFVIIYFLNNDTFEVQLSSLLCTSTIIVLVNTYAWQQNKTLFSTNQYTFKTFPYKTLIKYIIFVISMFLLVAIIVPLLTQSTNSSLLEKIFATSGFGHYSTRLQFKADYIKTSNPFLLNESNQTINTFEMLSNLGKEYIIKEKYPLKILNKEIVKQDGNLSNKAQQTVFMHLCWDKYENIGRLDKNVSCGEDNKTDPNKLTSTEQLFDSNASGFSVDYGDNRRWYTSLCWDVNKTIGDLSEATDCKGEAKLKLTPKQNNSYIFRINKDNVINEMTGEEPNKQTTMWVIN